MWLRLIYGSGATMSPVFTQADLTNLRKAGYSAPFKTVAEGVALYMQWLNQDK